MTDNRGEHGADAVTTAFLDPVRPVTGGAPPADRPLGRVHLIGIGGAGMSGIARILLRRGHPVSGSDAKDSRAVAALRALGAQVAVGHAAANLPEHLDTVVASTAIRRSNPEITEAVRRGVPVLPRAAALAAVMAGSRGVAVAGTHGKTTTTSMLTVALQHCGADPSFAIGGDLNEAGSNAHSGSGDLFVAEADESDGSFLLLAPYAAVVTNVEADHLDHYADLGAVQTAFDDFVHRIDQRGFLVLCADDPGATRLAAVATDRGLRVRTYGEHPAADVRLEGLVVTGTGSSAELVMDGVPSQVLHLRVPGRHNAVNAAAAFATGVELGLPPDRMREGLEGFAGVRRRLELKGTLAGRRVYDSYAHHHTEIRADLAAARAIAGAGRVVVAFQPHRYSRTAAFAPALGAALGLADHVVVMEVYAAGEEPVPGASGATVAAAVPLPPPQVRFEPSWSQVAAELVRRSSTGDVLLTLGAGDVTMLGAEVLDLLAERAR